MLKDESHVKYLILNTYRGVSCDIQVL